MSHAPMGRFQQELIYYSTYFSALVPSNVVSLSCRPFVVNTTFSTDLVGVEVSSVSWLGQLKIHLENNHRKINTLEEIEILKAASSRYLFNDVIAGQNDQYTNFSPHQ